MIRTIKWVYELGFKHGRNEVEMQFEKHRLLKPNKDDSVYDEDAPTGFGRPRDYEKDLDLWYAVEEEINKRLHPESYIDYEEAMKRFSK